jgi:predicted RNA binding protein YcfA (HicA-like mRNA interferase family)
VSPKLKRMSGAEVVDTFSRFGFTIESQRGSHVKLVRIIKTGDRQVLTIPNHKEIDTGTLQSIIRQASKYIDPRTLKHHFYTP